MHFNNLFISILQRRASCFRGYFTMPGRAYTARVAAQQQPSTLRRLLLRADAVPKSHVAARGGPVSVRRRTSRRHQELRGAGVHTAFRTATHSKPRCLDRPTRQKDREPLPVDIR